MVGKNHLKKSNNMNKVQSSNSYKNLT